MTTTTNGIDKKVAEILPAECQLSKVEFEGPDVIIYLKNISAFYSDDNLIRKIAGVLKKRVLIRSDPASLMPAEEARKAVGEIVVPEAGVQSVTFVPDFCEVIIEALKPGLVIGKGGSTLKSIILKTGWAPKILRTPTMPSATIAGIRTSMVKEADKRKKFLSALGKKICSPTTKSDWVKMTALGGFREVGRMSLLIQTPNNKLLIDCGVNAETNDPAKAYPYLNAMNLALDELDGVLVTHAHLDHAGFIPYLYKYGYDGPIYCTPPTRDLMMLLLFDYVDVVSKSGVTPPYDKKHIRKMLSRIVVRDYGEVTDITPETKLTFHNAGHILGSSQIHLHIGEGLHNLVVTGDMKFGFTRLFSPADVIFPRVETLFIESTYGGREDIMVQRQEADRRLMATIMKTVSEEKGKVLIPVFSVGRSQEIMLVLEEYAQTHPDFNFPVYIDGMILEASAIHTAYPEYLRANIQRRILSNNSPFESKIFETVKTHDRSGIVDGEPCVILAPSGMLSGGPAVDYLKRMAPEPKNKLVFVGYQSALSLGRKVQQGNKEIPILGDDGKLQSIKRAMTIDTVEGFSGHSDRHQLINFIKNIKPTPERVFTLHGDGSKCEDLAHSISRISRIDARAPMNLDSMRLK
ncbi:MAG: beta-CASP ribonuclease aCPSF1 [Candidatus Micrarchaeota archaeon]|nr:beta-CASP ribonuclease aCPSF1 [Candidatus Micrarchaeota archaeon]